MQPPMPDTPLSELHVHSCRTCVPTEVRRRGRVLLNQQLWLWGQDIRRPEGNALLEYGFERTRPPEGQKGSNTYTCQPAPGTVVTLWAFGLSYARADRGAVFLPRFTFTPRLVAAEAPPGVIWSPTQLPDCRAPRGAREWARAHRLFIPALRWIADYECWIAGRLGLPYRRACVEAWPKVRVPADRLADAWAQLIAECDAAMQAFIAARQPVQSPVASGECRVPSAE